MIFSKAINNIKKYTIQLINAIFYSEKEIIVLTILIHTLSLMSIYILLLAKKIINFLDSDPEEKNK